MNWNELIGRRVGQYTFLEEIGRGGSSRVYRATDAVVGRDVAIKAILNDAEDRVGFVRRFEREVRVVAQLHHPNIVSVYDRGETDDLVYLVMECVMGGTLKLRLGRPLPVPEAVADIVQMAQALHHAHQRGIVHRDVKPSNMLVDAADSHHLLLTDFGIAKLQGSRGFTKSGTTVGTPEYMAPEQAEGKEIDPRADVYALGCVLYEMLSGRPPFVGSTPVSVLYQQVHSRPAYIRGFNPEVPRELARIVEQALAKRPEERFGTAEILAEALTSSAFQANDTSARHAAAPPLDPRQHTPSTPSFETRMPHTAGPRVPPASGELWILNQSPTPPATPPPPRVGSGGLGEEGLDALFPHDAGMQPPSSPTSRPNSLPPAYEPPPLGSTRSISGPPGQPIPLPSFRLPAKPTRPLDLPLTADGRLDLDWLSQQEQEAARQYQAGMTGDYGDVAPTAGRRDPVAEPGRYVQGGKQVSPKDTPLYDESGEPVTALRRALLASGQPTGGSQRVWRPESGDLIDTARMRQMRKPASRGRHPLRIGVAVAAVLALLVVAWMGASAAGLGSTPHARVAATATSTLAPTAVPTSTAKPAPTATATTNPQQILNSEAAASFRGVILAGFVDSSCNGANSTSHFAAGQAVYVNLCLAYQLASSYMTVEIRQNGTVLFVLTSSQYVSPHSSYWYARFGLRSGRYDMLVTMPINGTTAVARDLAFTVG